MNASKITKKSSSQPCALNDVISTEIGVYLISWLIEHPERELPHFSKKSAGVDCSTIVNYGTSAFNENLRKYRESIAIEQAVSVI